MYLPKPDMLQLTNNETGMPIWISMDRICTWGTYDSHGWVHVDCGECVSYVTRETGEEIYALLEKNGVIRRHETTRWVDNSLAGAGQQ